jgi:hypothetical protein
MPDGHVTSCLHHWQDLSFPEASYKVRTTRDGRYLVATGTYKPRMKVYDLDELSLKFERVTDSENVDFIVSARLAPPPSPLTRF